MIKKFTVSQKKKITEDFNKALPSFFKYKNFWLLKVKGPFCIGVSLLTKPSNDRYSIEYHFTNLFIDVGSLTLGLSEKVYPDKFGNSKEITFERHSSSFNEIVSEIQRMFPLIDEDLSVKQMEIFIKSFLKKKNIFAKYPIHVYITLITLLIWYMPKKAKSKYLKFKKEVDSWDESIKSKIPKSLLLSFYELEPFLEDTENFNKRIHKNINVLKLSKYLIKANNEF